MLIHLRSNLRMLASLIRFSIISMSCSLTMESKYEAMSNSSTYAVGF